MRTLNIRQTDKKNFSRFSLPGFRSGSVVKKIIACVYYCFVFFNIFINGLSTALKADFQGGTDVFLYALFFIFALGAYLAPVIIVGFSDYYDLHGIKLFLVIISAVCVFMTCSMFVSSFFSDELKGINVQLEESMSEGAQTDNEPTPELEDKLIKENLEQTEDKTVDSASSAADK